MANNVWLGTISTDASQSGNWSLGRYPDSTDNVVWDGSSAVNCTLSSGMFVGAISVNTGYSGVLDFGSYQTSGVANGDFTLNVGSGGTINLNAATLTCDGNFDWSGAAGTITRGTSTVVMTGAGKTLKVPYSYTSPVRSINNLTIAADASITIPNTVTGHESDGLLTINGSLTINNTGLFYVNHGITQGSNGSVAGTGTLYLYNAGYTYTFANSAAIAPAYIWVRRSNSIPSGTYSPTVLFEVHNNSAGDQSFTWQAGTYTFTSPVNIRQYSAGVNTFTISGVNNPTLIFQGDVTVTQTTGTIVFSNNSTNPNQLTGTANQTVSLAGKDMGNWIINKPSAGIVTFTNGDTITAGGVWNATVLTVGAGVNIDLGDNAYSHTITGDVTLDCASFDMGNSTLIIGGNLDYKDVTTWNGAIGTIVMGGFGKTIMTKGTGDITKNPYNLTINGGTDIAASGSDLQVSNALVVNGILRSYQSLRSIYTGPVNGTLSIGSSGSVTGLGSLYIYRSNTGKGLISFQPGGDISVNNFYISAISGITVVAPGYYAASNVYISNYTTTNCTWYPSGTYNFAGNVTYKNDNAGTITTIDNSVYNPSFIYQKNLSYTQSAGTLTYTKGIGSVMLSGTNSQVLNIQNYSIEPLVINKSAGTVAQASNFTSTSFTLTSGNLIPSGYDITTGNFTLDKGSQITTSALGNTAWNVYGNFLASGMASSYINLNPATQWIVAVSGTGIADYVNVAQSNAGSGSPIIATHSRNLGGNINWQFPIATLNSVIDYSLIKNSYIDLSKVLDYSLVKVNTSGISNILSYSLKFVPYSTDHYIGFNLGNRDMSV